MLPMQSVLYEMLPIQNITIRICTIQNVTDPPLCTFLVSVKHLYLAVFTF